MFLPPFLIAVCKSSSPAFLVMGSVYRLNKQDDSRQPVVCWDRIPEDYLLRKDSFLNPEPFSCSIQGSNCCFLTRIQVSQEVGNMVRYSHLFKSFAQFVMTHTVKGFSTVNETEIDCFLEFSCFLYNPANVGNLIYKCGTGFRQQVKRKVFSESENMFVQELCHGKTSGRLVPWNNLYGRLYTQQTCDPKGKGWIMKFSNMF